MPLWLGPDGPGVLVRALSPEVLSSSFLTPYPETPLGGNARSVYALRSCSNG